MNLSDYCGQLTTCMIPYESKHLHLQILFRLAPKRQKYMLTFSVLKWDFFLWKTDYNTVLHYSNCATDPLAVLKHPWNDKPRTRWMFTQPDFYITRSRIAKSQELYLCSLLLLAFTVILHEMSFRLTPLNFEGAVNDWRLSLIKSNRESSVF